MIEKKKENLHFRSVSILSMDSPPSKKSSKVHEFSMI